MARFLNRLTSLGVKSLPPGKHADGGGLWFHRRVDGGAQWFLRITVHGRRREMGLGGYPDVGLKDARAQAERCRMLAKAGTDPIKARINERSTQIRNLRSLNDVTQDAFESLKASLKGDGKNGRWLSPLERHVLPTLGGMPVAEIDQRDIRDVLQPIWNDKAATAIKALNRLSRVLQHGAALGLDVDLQAPQKAKALLGKQRHTETHIKAMPWADVPAFYFSLGEDQTATALKLLILTAVRSHPLRHMRLDQIKDTVWTIPADAMKGQKGKTSDFAVPLSTEAQRLIEAQKPLARDGFLFPGVRRGVISDATLGRFMQRRGLDDRPHGFRSSFRDWTADQTDTPMEVAETALSHSVGNKVTKSYLRTDYLDRRAVLMERWSAFVTGETPTVVAFPKGSEYGSRRRRISKDPTVG